MGFLAWIILGAAAGWIASMIAGTNARQGWLMNIVVGIVGAIIGGWIVSFFTKTDFVAGFDIWSLIVAVGGAALLLFIVRLVTNRGS